LDNKSIFLIATISLDKDGNWKHVRTWYYFFTLDKAINAVLDNDWDIYEYGNEYAVIEEHSPGATIGPQSIYWYRWDAARERFKPTMVPDFAVQTINWTIG
jgi:hypothetical protein